jgi:hypothetical protein
MSTPDMHRFVVGAVLAAAAAVAVTRATPAAQFGGFGGVQPDRPLVAQFDKDGDKRLNAAERQAAFDFLQTEGGGGRGFGRRGGMGFAAPAAPGPKVARNSVKTYPSSVPFYDQSTLRTLFFDFSDANWEKELMAFKGSDVEVPATMVIDGQTYKDVGIRFRGSSSFMMVPEGLKHSIDVSVDFSDKALKVGGYRSLNLLNSHEDPSFLRSVLFLDAAREYVPAAAANLVRVVINGESWGVYANVEQVNKDFIGRAFKTEGGARWKVPGSPGGRGGLEYSGEDVSAYKRVFEIKTKDDPKSWAALVNLTKVLNQTPADRLEAALAPIFDIDGALKFLALDNTLVNNDGYWVRASDYNIYLDPKGVFHVFPHDTNETFAPSGGGPGGRGGFGGPPPDGRGRPGGPDGPGGFGPGGPGRGGRGGFMMGGSATLDPLTGLDDATKPLRSKLLAVPALRAKYLAYCRQIATKWLDWKTLGPIVTQAQAMIAADVKTDTRKLTTYEEFEASAQDLKTFADTRRALIMNYAAR